MIDKLDFEARSAIRCAMIDARGAARIGGASIDCFTLPIFDALSPLVDGWLPEGVIRNEFGKIVVVRS